MVSKSNQIRNMSLDSQEDIQQKKRPMALKSIGLIQKDKVE